MKNDPLIQKFADGCYLILKGIILDFVWEWELSILSTKYSWIGIIGTSTSAYNKVSLYKGDRPV